MKETLATKIVIYGALILGAFVPVVPTEIQNATWYATYEIQAYSTDDGLLSPTQYFKDIDGTYLVRGEEGFPSRVETLTEIHTEKVTQAGKNLFLNTYKKVLDETDYVVITDDKADYDRLKEQRLPEEEPKKPTIKEKQSLVDLAFDPIPVEAVITPDEYSFNASGTVLQTVTFSHVVTSADTIVVSIGVDDAGSDVPIQVTYNSSDLTQEVAYASTTHSTSLWYLVSPSAGTNNLFVDFGVSTASADDSMVSVQSVSGVDPADVFDATLTTHGQGTTTPTITHVAGGFGVDIMVSRDISITTNRNVPEGTRHRYFDSGAITFYSHEYYQKDALSTCSVGATETNSTGMFFKSDGTKMYVGGTGGDAIDQYSLSVAWDASTCTYDTKTLSVGAEDGTTADFFIKSDGTTLWMAGSTNDRIYQYTLATPWDISTGTYDSVSTSSPIGEGAVKGIFFKPDGTSLFISGTTLDIITEYSLSTPWDISTANYTGKTLTLGANPSDLEFTSDGRFAFAVQPTSGILNQYRLSTAWDVTTGTLTKYSLPLFELLKETTIEAVYMKDLSQFYIVGTTNDTVYTYKENTATTTTTMGLLNAAGNEMFIHLGGILKPYVAPVGGSVPAGGIIWFNED